MLFILYHSFQKSNSKFKSSDFLFLYENILDKSSKDSEYCVGYLVHVHYNIFMNYKSHTQIHSHNILLQCYILYFKVITLCKI